MTSVIAIQVVLSQFTNLSPWKGGGFGMFSTVSKRGLSCHAILQNGDKLPCKIRFAGSGEKGPLSEVLRRSFLHNPTQKQLDMIGRNFLRHHLVVDENRVDGIKQYYVTNTPNFITPDSVSLVKTLSLSVFEVGFNQQLKSIQQVDLNIKGEYAAR